MPDGDTVSWSLFRDCGGLVRWLASSLGQQPVVKPWILICNTANAVVVLGIHGELNVSAVLSHSIDHCLTGAEGHRFVLAP